MENSHFKRQALMLPFLKLNILYKNTPVEKRLFEAPSVGFLLNEVSQLKYNSITTRNSVLSSNKIYNSIKCET